jgi:hypothetical protein
MKRKAIWPVLALALVIIVAGAAAVSGGEKAKTGDEQVMEKENIIPPLDLRTPEVTETATFALG